MLDLHSLVNLDEGTVSPWVFSDPEIHKLEQERIFARTWLLLAHDSQIPNPGDFFTTWMGGDPVVVVRKRDRTVGAYLNACRHRGMKVCRADAGNAKAFTCTYHGWAYGLDGALVNVPNLDDAFYGELNPAEWGLVPVTQVDTYKGLIFGNFDPTAPPLLDYLGDMTFYLDCLVDRREGGVEVVPGIHKWSLQGNWKLAAEQFAGDNYHAFVSHASAFTVMLGGGASDTPDLTGALAGLAGRQFSSDWGHGSGFFFDPEGMIGSAWGNDPVLAKYNESIWPELEARLGKARVEGPLGSHNNIFPNASFLTRPVNTLRVWHSRGPNHFETWALTLVDAAAPDEVKERQRLATTRTFSGGGIFEQDDGENWGQIGENLARGGSMIHRTNFNYQMGMGHERDDDADFPGTIDYMPIGEGPHRRFYKRWLEFMTSEEWPVPASNNNGRRAVTHA